MLLHRSWRHEKLLELSMSPANKTIILSTAQAVEASSDNRHDDLILSALYYS